MVGLPGRRAVVDINYGIARGAYNLVSGVADSPYQGVNALDHAAHYITEHPRDAVAAAQYYSNPVNQVRAAVSIGVNLATSAYGGVVQQYSDALSGDPARQQRAWRNAGEATFNVASLAVGAGELGAVEDLSLAAEEVAAAHPLAGLAPSDVIDMAAARGLQTPRDSLILWSGLGRDGTARAQAFASEFGGTTLEMTPGGKWLDSMDLYGSSSPYTSAEADAIWGEVSGRMVGQASGQVRSVLGQVRPMSVYNRYELPALRENSQILGLDPLQVRPMIKASGY